MKTRNAVVEGRFYPSSKSRIFNQISEIVQRNQYPLAELLPERVFGAVLPHAGHLYSGYQTIPFLQLINKLDVYPETFVIVHPNHSGLGQALAIDEADVWTNSIGEVPVDREFARALELPFDHMAHAREHSAEVIIPFLQYFLPDHHFNIVPICMREQNHENALEVANRIRGAAELTGRQIMLIASCDFSHFLSPAEGESKDQLVLDEILARNSAGVEQVVRQNRISVCGYGPVMVLMEYARKMHETYEIKVLARGHSGEVHPSPEVVDYISMIIYR